MRGVWWQMGLVCVGLVCGGSAARAACPDCTSFAPGIVAGTVSFNALNEASGIAASARNHGVLWTHNDGSAGRIYAMSTNGARLATYDVNNVDDLEDVAVGPGPEAGLSYLYIGDIGGSVGTNVTRPDVKIIRVAEPFVDLAWANNPRSPSFNGRDTFTLLYPDGSYDAETLLVDPLTSDVWVVTKQTNVARFYRANVNALPDDATAVLEFVREVNFDQASAGDISADGSRIILRRENSAVLWNRCDGEPLNTSLVRNSQTIPIIGPPTEQNGEGIGFMRDGTGYVTISEGINPAIYFFRSLCPASPQFTLVPSNLTAFVGGMAQFQARAVGYPDPVYIWRFNGDVLSETSPVLTLANVSLGSAGQYEVTASNASGTVSTSATLTVRLKPDLRITEVMSQAAPSPGVPTADWWELTSFESQPVNLSGWRFNDSGGGLLDPYTNAGPLVIAPGESIIFAENLTTAEFGNWWGASNLPANLQIINFSGTGLAFAAGGDGVRLWDNVTVDANDPVASVDFGAAIAGATFNYNPATQQFGELSQLGVNGVFTAGAATDIGSPGWITDRPIFPVLHITRTGTQVRIEFDAEAGRRYALEVREDVASGEWAATGDVLQPPPSGRIFFERQLTEAAQFFRVSAQ